MQPMLTLVIAITLAACTFAQNRPAGTQSADDARRIPLEDIWADKMPGTRDLHELAAAPGKYDDVAVEQTIVVPGVGAVAKTAALRVRSGMDKPLGDFHAGQQVSLYFATTRAGARYIHLRSVSVADRTVTLRYAAVVHRSRELSWHAALIPLILDEPGKWTVKVEPVEGETAANVPSGTTFDVSDRPLTTEYADGVVKPADLPLQSRLVIRQQTYEVDPATLGRMVAARLMTEAREGPLPLNDQKLDLALQIRNNGRNAVTITVGGDASTTTLTLKGDGAVNEDRAVPMTMEFRMGEQVEIKPGKSHNIPITSLNSGKRDISRVSYWTQAGRHELHAEYFTMVIAEGVAEAKPVTLTPAPAPIYVVPARSDEARAAQGVRGRVLKLTGNHMPGPGIGGGGATKPLAVPVHVFKGQLKPIDKPDPDHPQLVKIVKSNTQGKFVAGLEPGEYTVVAEIDGKLYLNLQTGSGHWHPVTVKPDTWTRFNIEDTSDAAF